jgi:adenylate cyclase
VDIRNSTEYARNAKPADVQARVSAFLDAATRAITENDGFLMAFYGDCVVAVWPPGFSGPDHADKALKAARALIRPGLIPQNDAPVELGVGLHRGPVFIGTVSAAKGLFRDVSIFGSEVILCARLASDAAPGQVLATEATAATGPAAPRALKGFDTPVNVLEIGD